MSDAIDTSASIDSTVSAGDCPSGSRTAIPCTVAASANGRTSTRSTVVSRASSRDRISSSFDFAMPGATQ